jgi:UDP-N-acetylmuramoyl-L-alanyl-D-glutamate--2,6-diaminopimelate ligase
MMTEKTLPQILGQIPTGMVVSPVPDVTISGIAIDSRKVRPGDLFVALRGGSADGHRYIDDALTRGAAAIAGETAPSKGPAKFVQLADTRAALSFIAAAFHGWPARQLKVIGVTGTDGKTTTTSMIHGILREAGVRAGMISTVSAVIGGEEVDTGFHVTTPDAHDVQRYLAHMVAAGLTHVVLETTSHGWAQHRVDACEFDIGVVTNITHEHLDEHGSYEAYRAAKARLFQSLAGTA